MKIAILGTRGIPNYYGGFEQFAEFFSVYLVQKGHEVYCYNSHNHKFQEKNFHGVNIIHQHDPEYKYGTFGQFIYDYNCIIDSRKRDFDIILQLGYTSNSIWFFLLPKKPIIITNMDGIEWKRSKYSRPVQQFLRFAERLAAISSHYLVSDSLGIQMFLKKRYKKDSTYIAYGAHPFNNPNATKHLALIWLDRSGSVIRISLNRTPGFIAQYILAISSIATVCSLFVVVPDFLNFFNIRLE